MIHNFVIIGYLAISERDVEGAVPYELYIDGNFSERSLSDPDAMHRPTGSTAFSLCHSERSVAKSNCEAAPSRAKVESQGELRSTTPKRVVLFRGTPAAQDDADEKAPPVWKANGRLL